MPYILLFTLLSAPFLLLHLSLFLHYTRFLSKVQEPESPVKSGFFSVFLHLSLFLFFWCGHLCALCLRGSFSGHIFVQRCSCFHSL